jgi:iron complex transport system substrate-binding protein
MNLVEGFFERIEMFRRFLSVRFVIVVMFALVALFLVACSEGDDEAKSTAVTVMPTATATAFSDVVELMEQQSTATVVAVVTQKPVATVMATATAVPIDTDEPVVAFDEARFANVDGIVDPTNFGWPRSIETSEGVITLDAPPMKIHSLSLGHSEILAALVDFDRLTAVYSFFVDEEQSNIAELSSDSLMIGFDPEEVVALEPEVIIASSFTNADTVALMTGAGIPIARAALENSPVGNVPNILLMGYLVGAEVKAIELADELISRMQFISDVLDSDTQPRVLSVSKWTSAFAAGSGSTEGRIIEQAGGINAAADLGIEGHQQVSIESIAAINPDVIIVPQPLDGANTFIAELTSSAVLAEVPAVKNGEIYYVPPRYHTTLSHWNMRGIEDLATLLFPSHFSGVEFEEFSQFGE